VTTRPPRAPFWVRRLLTRSLRRPSTGPRRLGVLVLGLVVIAVWQRDFFAHATQLDPRYTQQESSGINAESRFVYFLYYLGLYPVVATDGHARLRDDPGYRKFQRQAAERVIAERGETLSMEAGRETIRGGDLGRTLLYLPYAIWTGSARDPRLSPTSAVAFVVALGILYTAFWWARDPLLGALSVALLGSNPYQLWEVHASENVFGWAIITGIAVLGLSLPLLARRGAGRLAWLLPLVIGVLVGTVRQIRPEPVTMLGSAALACLLLSRASWRRRLAFTAVLLAAFVATSRIWSAYFDYKFEQARAVVAAAGGRPYEGPRHVYHSFWHPLWCGLGDFGQKYGYRWRDKSAIAYAEPIVEARYRAMGREPDLRYLVWDPVYDQVLAEKIRYDVSHDPLWYLGVLARRVVRVLSWTTPVRLAAGPWHATLPWNAWATLPLIAALVWMRSGALLKLALFPLATSAPAVLVFSGTYPGQTWTGWVHILGAAIVLAALVDAAVLLGRRAWRARAPAAQRTTDLA
jgi:hypothetical protein